MSDLPKGWVKATIGEVADVQLGRQRSPKNHTGDHMRPYLRAANVTWSGVSLDDVKEMNFDPVEAKRFELHDGDLLLNEASGSPNEVGKPAIWRNEIPGACFQNTLIRIRSEGPSLRYLYWYCYRSALLGEFGAAGRGVNIRHLGKQGLARFPIPLPPFAEQERIVAAIEEHFSHLDAAEASLARALRATETLEQSAAIVIREEAEESLRSEIVASREHRWLEAVDQKLAAHPAASKGSLEAPITPSADLPALPAGWQWSTLDEVTHFVVDYRGKTPPRSESGVPVVSAANVRNGVVEIDDTRLVSKETYSNWIRRGLPECGDLVITTEAPVAAVALWPDGGPYLPTRRVMVLKTGLPDNRFLMQALRHPEAQAHIRRHMRGTTVPRILKPQLMATPIPLPSGSTISRLLGEVESIASRVESARSAIKAAISRSASLRRSVLLAAFAGELVPQGPSDEPASDLLGQIRTECNNSKFPRPDRKASAS